MRTAPAAPRPPDAAPAPNAPPHAGEAPHVREDEGDAERRWMHRLRDLGFEPTAIGSIVREWGERRGAPRAMTQTREAYAHKLAEVRAQLGRLRERARALEGGLVQREIAEVCEPAARRG